jgi:hypothetical protein
MLSTEFLSHIIHIKPDVQFVNIRIHKESNDSKNILCALAPRTQNKDCNDSANIGKNHNWTRASKDIYFA